MELEDRTELEDKKGGKFTSLEDESIWVSSVCSSTLLGESPPQARNVNPRRAGAQNHFMYGNNFKMFLQYKILAQFVDDAFYVCPGANGQAHHFFHHVFRDRALC